MKFALDHAVATSLMDSGHWTVQLEAFAGRETWPSRKQSLTDFETTKFVCMIIVIAH